MSIKRAIATILIIGAAFALFIIWYRTNHDDMAATSSEFNKSYRIYLITIDKTDQYWYSLDKGASDMASILGVTYTWDAPEQRNTAQQIEIIKKAIENDADLIMLAANDPISLEEVIEDAKAKSVRFIYVDTPAYEEATVTLSTDNHSAGITAAETMIAKLEEAGITKGSIGIIGVNETTISTLNRERGFRETLEKDGRFVLLPTINANGDPIASQEAAAKLISENSNLVGIFGVSEGSTEGVGNAIKADNNRITGIGFDKSDANLALLRGNSLRAIIAQNPYTMGYLGMAEAYAALKGLDTGPPNIDTGVTIITRR
jgi:ribose transport system substrate-binding protein